LNDPTEYTQQVEPSETEPVPQAAPDSTRFDPWIGIGYHVIQVLFLVVAGFVAVNLAGEVPDLTGPARTNFLFTLGMIGVPAIGMAIALRLGQLDLSVGAMAAFATAIYAANDGGSSALLVAIGTALAIGAVTGAVSGVLRIPAWLSTFALSFVLLARFLELVGPNPAAIAGDPPDVQATPMLAVVFVGVGLGAAVVFLVLDVLRRPGQVKRIEELALGFRILLPAVALTVSAGFAAYAGVMQAERVQFAGIGLESILPAILAAVLIGGVGVFGARVSLGGTMLGALGLALIQYGVQLASESGPSTQRYAVALPLVVFVVLRGLAAAVRGERIPA
jgi:ribose/xylose/arabinose/galactoside ABC-type transport system permease subunit